MRVPRARLTRDGTLFVVGLAGIANETLRENAERPTLLILFAAMCGLPAFLRTDEKQQAKPAPPPDPGLSATKEPGPGP